MSFVNLFPPEIIFNRRQIIKKMVKLIVLIGDVHRCQIPHWVIDLWNFLSMKTHIFDIIHKDPERRRIRISESRCSRILRGPRVSYLWKSMKTTWISIHEYKSIIFYKHGPQGTLNFGIFDIREFSEYMAFKRRSCIFKNVYSINV